MTRRRLSFSLLRIWARSAVKVVYGRVSITGAERVATEGPVIFAMNHSNALADVAVIVAKAPKFPHFLAAASWWRKRYARMLFAIGGVLPLQRRRDGDGPFDNAQTFEACSRALAEHAHLVIFPEGVMHPEPVLRPLKTGAARIGLGAAESGVRGVTIVPVGLDYEDRGRFRSDAVYRYGRPLVIDDWLDQYRADQWATVRAVTAELAKELACVSTPRPFVKQASALERRRRRREMALLTVPAAVGAVAHAPILAGGAVVPLLCDDMWQATVRGVGGTVLLPALWAGEGLWLARRYGFRRAAALMVAVAACGACTLGWIDRKRALDRREGRPASNPDAAYGVVRRNSIT